MDIKKAYGALDPYATNRLQENQRAQQEQAVNRQSGAAEQNTGDKVALSPEARLLGATMIAANAAPDTRAEKVRSLKEQVQSGTYKPDIKKAAANLIRDDLNLLR
ncbi:MAG: flagellar biosynthesis anti-sigma factor FlgM [Humidesulfovibrio sp.]|nr:flagellar biosynthesis anti-sigma factor FlgM [Humidesulfovibrio sp.]